jgi:hypothetical protein
MIPLLMFGTLASLFVLTWHDGALLRAVMRRVLAIAADASADAGAQTRALPVTRRRVDIGAAGRVRVHADELAPEEVLGQTELPSRLARRR